MWNCLKSFTFILDVIIFLNVEVRLAIESIELTGDEKANRTREEEKKKSKKLTRPDVPLWTKPRSYILLLSANVNLSMHRTRKLFVTMFC